MAAAARNQRGQQQLVPVFTYAGATITGLVRRPIPKSQGKYFIRLAVDGGNIGQSREIKTRKGTVSWTILKVTLYKSHSKRPVEEVGMAEMPPGQWLETKNPIPLVCSSTSNATPVIQINLVCNSDEKDGAEPGTDDSSVGLVVNEVIAASGTMHVLSTRGDLEDIASRVKDREDPLESIENAWGPLLDKMNWFVDVTNVVCEVHPFAKIACSAIKAAYKAVKAQRDRDEKIMTLVDTMEETYDFIKEARQSDKDARELDKIRHSPGNDHSREKALIRLASQTSECADFIKTYCKDKGFLSRLAKQLKSSPDKVIKRYQDAFISLRQDFRDGSKLRMELATFRMALKTDEIVAEVEAMGATLNIDDIHYVEEAGYDPDKCCLPGTQTALLETITEWANSESSKTAGIFVLLGLAGTGKSTIAHTIAGRLSESGQLGSMFCFNRNEAGTRKPVALCRNIANDLCAGRPAFKAALSMSVRDDKNTCGTANIVTQFQRFLLKPAGQLDASGTIGIVVDALDESGTPSKRKQMLQVLARGAKEIPVCFRFFLVARDETDISDVFQPTDNVHVTRLSTLERQDDLVKDILAYIRYFFNTDIIKVSQRAMESALSDDQFKALARRSEGVFQWASLACQYITTSQAELPLTRYRHVMAHQDNGLDELYKTALAAVFPQQTQDSYMEGTAHLNFFRSVMGMILTLFKPLPMTSILAFLDSVYPEPPVDWEIMLRSLGSLLSGVNGVNLDEKIRPLHISFSEFLQDASRAGEFFIGNSGHHERLAEACLRLLDAQLHFNIGGIASSYLSNSDMRARGGFKNKVSAELAYACAYWGHHLAQCNDEFRHRFEIACLLRQFFTRKLLFWVEAASVADILHEVHACLDAVGDRLPAEIRIIAQDAGRFIRTFRPCISISAAHTYISALGWTPTTSKVADVYRGYFSHIHRVASPLNTMWPAPKHLPEHDAGVLCVVFSNDDKRIESGSDDRTVRVSNAAAEEDCSPVAAISQTVAALDVRLRVPFDSIATCGVIDIGSSPSHPDSQQTSLANQPLGGFPSPEDTTAANPLARSLAPSVLSCECSDPEEDEAADDLDNKWVLVGSRLSLLPF
ncbi:hypothetical protein DACRYDRAFT_118164 [Dacryopinax primogenitus]|uniref:Nephrocystin 3-like N-terminal domain-containing protein n=1 Tax=Dacryopinax primogenitus (strain DJM 731) TaxID=1858805 RepID=M5FTN0_DACPD|nr:uncharacterized protein DACRYDRAFT_118164 [Dacryopinax primogenitus]EJT99458.1 hypothetical protein DACRYDRAFT_118164 [Dacryopinax primogenitus]